MKRVLLISVKPEFAYKILDKSKTIELRKAIPKVNIGDLVIIYCTSPVKEVVGICRVKDIIIETPQNLWKEYEDKTGIDKERYFEYFEDYKRAIGIVLKNINKLKVSIKLEKIRYKYPKFSPPQTYRYFRQTSILKMYSTLTK